MLMKRLTILILLIFIHCICFAGDRNKQIDLFLDKMNKKLPIPGFSVVLVDKDTPVYTKAFGTKEYKKNSPVHITTSFAIGSLTKSFTALAILQLVEQNKINLDDKVIKYLPWFRTADKENSNKITIRMLLSNSSGLPSTDQWIYSSDESGKAMEKGVRNISAFSTKRNPGESFEYSNEGFNTLGVIIEKISGITYADYLKKYIFVPLEMNNSSTKKSDIENLDLSGGHFCGILEPLSSTFDFSAEALAAGSELCCSAEDLGKYLVMLINEGKYKNTTIIQKQSRDLLWNPVISFPGKSYKEGGNEKDIFYCLGWMKSDIDGREVVHHGGNTGDMSSYTIIDPDKKQGVAILANIDSLNPYVYESLVFITNNVLHIYNDEHVSDFSIPKEEDPYKNDFHLSEHLKKEYIGHYISVRNTDEAEVLLNEKNDLIANIYFGARNFQAKLDFINQGKVAFRSIGMTMPGTIDIDVHGKVRQMTVAGFTYIRKQNLTDQNYNTIQFNKFKLKLLKDLTITVHKEQFIAEDSSTTLFGVLIDKHDFNRNEIIHHYFPGFIIINKNEVVSEKIGNNHFYEQAFVTKQGAVDRALFIVYTDTGNKYLLFALSSSPRDFSINLIKIINPLLQGLVRIVHEEF